MSKPANPFRYFNSSPEVVRAAVMLYIRYPLSLRNIEDLLFERGIDICHETVRFWWNRFGPMFAAEIRRRRINRMRGFRHWRWHLDEMYVKLNAEMVYLWRAVDHEGEILESFITRKRDKSAALAFMKKALKRHGKVEAIVTDGLRSYRAAMDDLGCDQKQEIGRWEGHITVNGKRQEIRPATTYGTKDRSWGWRWTGEPEVGVAREQPEQFFWLWAPIHWEDRCTHWDLNEYADGKRWKQFAQVFPTHPIKTDFDTLKEGEVDEVFCGEHRLTFLPGSRMLGRSEIDTLYPDGRKETFVLEPMLRYHMIGTGYNHPEWGHGHYKGETAHTLESWDINDFDVNLPRYLHVQHVVRVTCGDKVGVGAFEQYITRPHQRYGLTGFLDPVK